MDNPPGKRFVALAPLCRAFNKFTPKDQQEFAQRLGVRIVRAAGADFVDQGEWDQCIERAIAEAKAAAK
jgi:hypothetical protein